MEVSSFWGFVMDHCWIEGRRNMQKLTLWLHYAWRANVLMASQVIEGILYFMYYFKKWYLALRGALFCGSSHGDIFKKDVMWQDRNMDRLGLLSLDKQWPNRKTPVPITSKMLKQRYLDKTPATFQNCGVTIFQGWMGHHFHPDVLFHLIFQLQLLEAFCKDSITQSQSEEPELKGPRSCKPVTSWNGCRWCGRVAGMLIPKTGACIWPSAIP